MPLNKKYSYRDFSDRDLSDGSKFELYDHATRGMLTFDPANELKSGDEIKGTCFAQQIHAKSIFPAGVMGLTLIDCNCDNVILPPGSKVEGGAHKRIRPFPGTKKTGQPDELTDTEDWFCDWVTGKPLKPLREKDFIAEGRSIDPTDIPSEHIIEVVITDAEYKKISKEQWEAPAPKGDNPLVGTHHWFCKLPTIIKTVEKTARIETEKANWEKMLAANDYAPFDRKPKVEGEIQRPARQLRVPERTKKLLGPGRVAAMERDVPATTCVLLQGDMTVYTVRGEGWLYRGQQT